MAGGISEVIHQSITHSSQAQQLNKILVVSSQEFKTLISVFHIYFGLVSLFTETLISQVAKRDREICAQILYNYCNV